MKKRALSLLLALCLVLGLFPAVSAAEVASGSCGEHLNWVLSEDGTLTISGTGEMAAYDSPWRAYRNKITALVVEEGITSIGENAFNSFSEETEESETYPNLTTVTLPATLKRISSGAFAASGIKHIDIPEGVTRVERSAFDGCTSLESVSFPSTLEYLGLYAFAGCSKLAHVDMSAVTNNFGNYGVFSDCDALQNLDFYVFPKIWQAAFTSCDGFTVLDIPEGVTQIQSQAFSACPNLCEVTFPESLEELFPWCFSDCPALNIIRFTGDAPDGDQEPFYNVTATAYYPSNNSTWTSEAMANLGMSSNLTWVPYNPDNPFTDVPLDAYYEEPVLWAVENGITDGVSETSFAPDDQCLRSQVVTFLHRAAKNPAPASTDNPFKDVKPGDYFYNPVLWAVEKGITDGVADDLFGSNDVCTRGQVVTFLWRAAGEPKPQSTENPFEDVKPSDYFYKPVLWALENEITDGVTETSFAPGASCTRAQVVTFLHRSNN